MAYLDWKSEYSVGITSIDEQHKKLFQFINELHDAMKAGKSKEVLSKIINDLVDYTKYHFAQEEAFFNKYKYPEYLQHQKEHQGFTEKIFEFKNSYNLTSGIVSIEVMNFLKNWLINHVLGTDKKYTSFLNAKGVK